MLWFPQEDERNNGLTIMMDESGKRRLITLVQRSILSTCLFTGIGSALPQTALAVKAAEPANHPRNSSDAGNTISPTRKIQRDTAPKQRRKDRPPIETGYRSIDGSDNNLSMPAMGAAHTQLLRLFLPRYQNGLDSLAGSDRPNPRAISNYLVAQLDETPNPHRNSDFLWQWGQFLDHDIDLTDGVEPAEPANIAIPADDLYFVPGSEMAFNRSLHDHAANPSLPRQQINEITAWIDASNVYGSDATRAMALRTMDGSGRMKTSRGRLLPYNSDGLPNAGGDSAELFLGGDVRANEQVGLAAMHTLFVREHNRLARIYRRKNPHWSGEQIYQKARQIVGAQMQVITYNEFLPALLGPGTIAPYRGYRPDANAGIRNSFSTAAFRFGHSALSPQLLRLNRRGKETRHGHLPLRDAFFSPWRLRDEGGIEPVLRGLAQQRHQAIDHQVIDDVRNFLFGTPAAGGFDLASLNIQRGRDHGLPSYNEARVELGLPAALDFTDISEDAEVQYRLAAAYDNVDQVDLWAGGLAETALPGSHLGRLFTTILTLQFEALRDGDRYWYKRTLTRLEIAMIERTRLSDIIRANTSIGFELQRDVFRVPRYYKKRW